MYLEKLSCLLEIPPKQYRKKDHHTYTIQSKYVFSLLFGINTFSNFISMKHNYGNKLLALALLFLGTSLYTSAQNYQWAFPIGVGQETFPEAMVLDNSGNPIIVGGIGGNVDFDPGAGSVQHPPQGGDDIFVAKYDANMNHTWSFRLGSWNVDRALSVQVDAQNNVYITGSFKQTVDFDPGSGVTELIGGSASSSFVAKYDQNGAFLWVNHIPQQSIGYDIFLDAAGDVYVVGEFGGTVDFDPTAGTYELISVANVDGFISKYSSAGAWQWAKQLEGNQSKITCIRQLSSGELIIGGEFTGTTDFDPDLTGTQVMTSGTTDIFFGAYDTDGELLWVKQLASEQGGWGVINDLEINSQNQIHLFGEVFGTINTDPNGIAHVTAQGSNGDVLLAQYNATGALQWSFNVGANVDDGGNDISIDADDYIYATGFCDPGPFPTIDLDPSANNSNTSSTTNSGFMAIYSSSSTFVWAETIEGQNAYAQGQGLMSDENGHMYAYGKFGVENDFDYGPGDATLIGFSNDGCIYLAKYDDYILSITPAKKELSIKLYPNPTTARVAIEVNDQAVAAISLFDAMGRLVRSYPTDIRTIDLAEYDNGIYLISIDTDDGSQSYRVVKQKP
jgi:hypothetical protein